MGGAGTCRETWRPKEYRRRGSRYCVCVCVCVCRHLPGELAAEGVSAARQPILCVCVCVCRHLPGDLAAAMAEALGAAEVVMRSNHRAARCVIKDT